MLFRSYLLFNPARKMLQKRQDRIRTDIDTAARDREDANKLMEDYDRKLKDINKEAEEILSAARQKALKNEARIIEEAKEEAARIIARASAQVELERKKAADDMKKEIISIASLMAGKVVKASIDMEAQDSLIEDTLKEIGDQTWQS